MALRTLENTKQIYGSKVMVMDDLKKNHPEYFNESGSMDYARFEKEIRPNYPVQIRHDKNSISFTIQNGPIKENGKNGCQIETMIAATKLIIQGLNAEFPSTHNVAACNALDLALTCLELRTADRTNRGVEGTSHV